MYGVNEINGQEKMKLTFASQYSRKTSNLEYPLELYCYGHFEVKSCDYYSQDCPQSCSFAKLRVQQITVSKKESITPRCAEEDKTSKVNTLNSFSSPHSIFRNGLERFIAKWGDKWKK
jgi:hypothetical protein